MRQAMRLAMSPTSIPPQPSNERECSMHKPIGVRFVEWISERLRKKVNQDELSPTTTTRQGKSEGCSVTPVTKGLLVGDETLFYFSKPIDTLNVRKLSVYRLYCDRCYGLVGWVFGWGPYCKRCEIMYLPTGPSPHSREELRRFGHWLKNAVKRGTLAPM